MAGSAASRRSTSLGLVDARECRTQRHFCCENACSSGFQEAPTALTGVREHIALLDPPRRTAAPGGTHGHNGERDPTLSNYEGGNRKQTSLFTAP
jgi:hypothetical protein